MTAEKLKQMVRGTRAPVVLVNVWATWCAPCVEEFPGLLKTERKFRGRGVKVFLVSADFEANLPAVHSFLKAQGVDFPSYIKQGPDTEFVNALSPRWSGALPATFVFDSKGILRDFHEGRLTEEVFSKMISDLLEQRKRSRR